MLFRSREGAKCCDQRVYLYEYYVHSPLKNHTSKVHEIFCPCYLWL